MSTNLEIPYRPGWPTSPEGRIEPPQVSIEPRWEYKEVVREAAGELPAEAELDALGEEGWELAGVALAGELVHFYFKRERRR